MPTASTPSDVSRGSTGDPSVSRIAAAAWLVVALALGVLATAALAPGAAHAFEGYEIAALCGPDSNSSMTLDALAASEEQLAQPGTSVARCSAAVSAPEGTLGVTLERVAGTGGVAPLALSLTSFRERITITGAPAGPVTITARMPFDAEAVATGAASGSVIGSLQIGNVLCNASRRVRSNGEVIVGGGAGGCGSGETMEATASFAEGALFEGAEILVRGELRAEIASVPSGTSVDLAASGALSIEVAGAPFALANPSSLTVPEPAAAGAGGTALAALLALIAARSPRGRGATR